MGNMSYCRFENTYHDLSDCMDVILAKQDPETEKFDLKFGEKLSESEEMFMRKIIEMCKEITAFMIESDE